MFEIIYVNMPVLFDRIISDLSISMVILFGLVKDMLEFVILFIESINRLKDFRS